MHEPHDPSGHDPSESASPRVKKSRRVRLFSLRGVLYVVFLASLIYLIIVPVVSVLMDVPAEIARWHEAAAFEDYLAGNFPRAIVRMNDAIAWDADSPQLYLRRAGYRAATGDAQGQDDDRREFLNLTDGSEEYINARSQIFQLLGEHKRAIEELKPLEEQSRDWMPTARAIELNRLAYTRAVAETDLEKALEEINAAIDADMKYRQKQEDDRHRGLSGILGYFFNVQKRPVVEQPNYLDTRGYILYLVGKHQAARPDLDRAVEMIETQFTQYYGRDGVARHHMLDHGGEFLIDSRELRYAARGMAYDVAVILYHRALVLDKLGESVSANTDYRRIRELGFTPGKELH